VLLLLQFLDLGLYQLLQILYLCFFLFYQILALLQIDFGDSPFLCFLFELVDGGSQLGNLGLMFLFILFDLQNSLFVTFVTQVALLFPVCNHTSFAAQLLLHCLYFC